MSYSYLKYFEKIDYIFQFDALKFIFALYNFIISSFFTIIPFALLFIIPPHVFFSFLLVNFISCFVLPSLIFLSSIYYS